MQLTLLLAISAFALISNVKVQAAAVKSVTELYDIKDTIIAKLNSAEYDAAVKEADKLIEILAPAVTKPGELYAALLVQARFGRYEALEKARKYPEAVIEALKMKEACVKYAVCSSLLAQKHVDLMNKKIMETIQMEIIGPQAQLSPAAVKKALMKLRLVLHPDKNANLDADSKAQLSDTFIRINDAFEKYKERTGNI